VGQKAETKQMEMEMEMGMEIDRKYDENHDGMRVTIRWIMRCLAAYFGDQKMMRNVQQDHGSAGKQIDFVDH
jgi:hypothetical protein